MGPPPTSHFHVLADTPAGLQPINPPKTPQPSAARTMLDLDGRRVDKDADGDTKPNNAIGTEFGLRTDQYDRRNAALKKATAAIASRDWTEQETLLLLEGTVTSGAPVGSLAK
jgi:SWI/SNF related-matrix-associated actin-dependent regulator of chromatin subfamily C